MTLPSLEKAEQLLLDAESRNPGPWVQHSRNTALAAKLISEYHPSLDPHRSNILGLLHDIGRREGVTHMRHIIDGYKFLSGLGYEAAARISLTHSFPIADIDVYFGEKDCGLNDIDFLISFLSDVHFNEYDRLIQLCDAVSLPSGFCLMEKRLVDVVLRLGINDLTIKGWKARFQIINEFESVLGRSIYSILPGIIEGTFGNSINNSVIAS